MGGLQVLRPDLHRVRLPLANAYLLGAPGGPWVMVDAGTPGTAPLILQAARRVHGERPPEAIVLTHGHLDHVGALHALLAEWRVPVYAHPLELPQLNGQMPYPFPDPTVGGGGTSLISPVFVPGPFDFRPHLQALPVDGTLPALPDWTWHHTPGHAPGHVSLWRTQDRTLIVGDAFVTTTQESLGGAFGNRPQLVHRPPAYYTPNWDLARASVRMLALLQPALAATGHGHPMEGDDLRAQLSALAANFDEVARPTRGYYLRHPVAAGMPVPLRRRSGVSWALVVAVGAVWLLLATQRWRSA